MFRENETIFMETMHKRNFRCIFTGYKKSWLLGEEGATRLRSPVWISREIAPVNELLEVHVTCL